MQDELILLYPTSLSAHWLALSLSLCLGMAGQIPSFMARIRANERPVSPLASREGGITVPICLHIITSCTPWRPRPATISFLVTSEIRLQLVFSLRMEGRKDQEEQEEEEESIAFLTAGAAASNGHHHPVLFHRAARRARALLRVRL